MLRRNILTQHLQRLMVSESYDLHEIDLTRGFEFLRESKNPFEDLHEYAENMPRRSQRIAGDEDKKDETHPQLYDEPPHKLVQEDESTWPPKDADLSAMWVYQIVRCPFISQEMRYQRWPSVFPSKEPLRGTWKNKGLPAKLWSDVRMKWVYPVIFGKYQLHGDEGAAAYDIDQSEFIDSTGTNATHDIQEGAECVVQKPPASSEGKSSGGLAPAKSKFQEEEEPQLEPKPKRQKTQTGIRSKIPIKPISQKSPEPKAAALKVAITPSKGSKSAAPKAAVSAKVTPDKKSAAPTAKTPKPSPSTKIISSATGGSRFVIEESDSEKETKGADVEKLNAEIAALKLENAHCQKALLQAQGKVVLLAAALHSTWNILGTYSDRMVGWSTILKKWQKAPDGEELKDLMTAMSDNKALNNKLLLKANATFNEICTAFPALDRITMTDADFDEWRNAAPKGLDKLIEEGDVQVDGHGKVVVKKEED